MALTVKSIAAGTITGTGTNDVVTNSTTKSILINNIMLTNNHTANAVLAAVYVRRYVTSAAGYQNFPITPKDLIIPPRLK